MNAPPPVLANPGRRLLAVVIDAVIAAVALSVISAAVGVVVTVGGSADNSPFYLTPVTAVAMVFLYSPLLTATCGGTVGKLICGLVRVADGRRLPYGQLRPAGRLSAPGARPAPGYEPARGKLTSTLRFFLRPSSVLLSAIGYCSP
ncbi:hypothetical protein HEK616_60190 [Streptomyces nigrescens]|uniref:RDD domain-containing protein n=1 Tax=Streptomyces nigrescens TaxID=1920 RepID=A0ABM8A1W6_STRNI|nr:RDD family protein [Streptomyces nigrescens]BDM72532.1 hypothetical protein HEK616_60190 [Streptomyces nigrescens]